MQRGSSRAIRANSEGPIDLPESPVVQGSRHRGVRARGALVRGARHASRSGALLLRELCTSTSTASCTARGSAPAHTRKSFCNTPKPHFCRRRRFHYAAAERAVASPAARAGERGPLPLLFRSHSLIRTSFALFRGKDRRAPSSVIVRRPHSSLTHPSTDLPA